jgi:phosphatidylethanolamine/phosphatidyl-N-methylethanolamine N-methyltransferase
MSDALLPARPGRLPDWILFLGAWVRAPRTMGAIAPSGAALADRIAAEVPLHGTGPLVELGSGTGALTRALAARVGSGRLVLVERDAAFCRRLAVRFPDARILQGDAADLPALLHGLGPASAVVSGLPLYAMAPEGRARIVAAALAATRGGPFVQFSYIPRFPVRGPWQARRTAAVWRNLPPAFVFVVRS